MVEMPGHAPVLLGESVAGLGVVSGGRYLDGTFGGGGHTRAILDASGPDGTVIALDADPAAVERAERLATEPAYRGRLIPVHANFASLAEVAANHGQTPLDGVLLDLGMSSFQLDSADRGFAFRFDGPLDMRFDPTRGEPAATLVNELDAEALATVLYRYGDESRSRRIARMIVAARDRGPIASTGELASIIEAAVGGRRGAPTHPATRSFQALRIAVNDELAALHSALDGAVAALGPRGRLAVISFHSMEDRIVKRFIADRSATCVCPPEMPVCTCDARPALRKVGGGVRAAEAERLANPRSRSATLRVAERTDHPAPVGDGASARLDGRASGAGGRR
ncbi:MAG: 16S rRNA (cytosine(1402)-N(4))-methyltransferase [uncultured Thermomicrobiales bacterium]|uniref:Ribosomal RNA small subunit methyltransferase H n=1 Tax=uncultured Thermomicrobiales bacterium TaxID=1645740 RepID=A0A6J4UV09_9BACT|nr:MAG: 16S rRNA (cytosine(1402)-N(4))-methyltransferase [uncultured Thermomicrobiales bacterium]